MSIDLKKIVSALILGIGMFAFILSISNNNLNFALIYLTSTLIFWVFYGLVLDAFDIRIFAWIISASGFLIAISVLFMFGIEEVPYPVGAIVFHSIGFVGALGISLLSFFPILILHQMNPSKNQGKTGVYEKLSKDKEIPPIFSEDWEMVSDDELQSGEFEVG